MQVSSAISSCPSAASAKGRPPVEGRPLSWESDDSASRMVPCSSSFSEYDSQWRRSAVGFSQVVLAVFGIGSCGLLRSVLILRKRSHKVRGGLSGRFLDLTRNREDFPEPGGRRSDVMGSESSLSAPGSAPRDVRPPHRRPT